MYWRLIPLEEIIQISIISSKDINLQFIDKIYCRELGQHLMQQKRRTLLQQHFLKKYPT